MAGKHSSPLPKPATKSNEEASEPTLPVTKRRRRSRDLNLEDNHARAGIEFQGGHEDAVRALWNRQTLRQGRQRGIVDDTQALDDTSRSHHAHAADPAGLDPVMWAREFQPISPSTTPESLSVLSSEAASRSHDPEDERGASDFSDEEERQCYISARRQARLAAGYQKRKAALEESRASRLRAMQEYDGASTSNSIASSRTSLQSSTAPLSESQFSLMVRTADAVRNSPRPAQLELKIMANHRQDEHFEFLRSSSLNHSIWTKLRQGERLRWCDVDPQRTQEKHTMQQSVSTLLGVYDSESEDEEVEQNVQVKNESPLVLGEHNDQGVVKEGQRATISRARAWAEQRRRDVAATSTTLRDDSKSSDDGNITLLHSETDVPVDSFWETEERLKLG